QRPSRGNPRLRPAQSPAPRDRAFARSHVPKLPQPRGKPVLSLLLGGSLPVSRPLRLSNLSGESRYFRKYSMIKVRNLTKSYRVKNGRHYVFRDVDAVFPEGVNIGIIGPNGGGKSTFLRILGGIDFPDSGEIATNCSF